LAGDSEYCWVQVLPSRNVSKRCPGTTKGDAEWWGLYSIVKLAPDKADLLTFTTELWLIRQFDGQLAVGRANHKNIANLVTKIIQDRGLTVWLALIPRRKNLAAALIDQQ
jgi:hypothetical protein